MSFSSGAPPSPCRSCRDFRRTLWWSSQVSCPFRPDASSVCTWFACRFQSTAIYPLPLIRNLTCSSCCWSHMFGMGWSWRCRRTPHASPPMNNAYQHADHTTRMRSTLMQAERRLGLPPCLLQQTFRAKREFRVYSSGIRTGPPRRRAWSAVVCRWTRIRWDYRRGSGSMKLEACKFHPTGRPGLLLDWGCSVLGLLHLPVDKDPRAPQTMHGQLDTWRSVSGPGWCFDNKNGIHAR